MAYTNDQIIDEIVDEYSDMDTCLKKMIDLYTNGPKFPILSESVDNLEQGAALSREHMNVMKKLCEHSATVPPEFLHIIATESIATNFVIDQNSTKNFVYSDLFGHTGKNDQNTPYRFLIGVTIGCYSTLHNNKTVYASFSSTSAPSVARLLNSTTCIPTTSGAAAFPIRPGSSELNVYYADGPTRKRLWAHGGSYMKLPEFDDAVKIDYVSKYKENRIRFPTNTILGYHVAKYYRKENNALRWSNEIKIEPVGDNGTTVWFFVVSATMWAAIRKTLSKTMDNIAPIPYDLKLKLWTQDESPFIVSGGIPKPAVVDVWMKFDYVATDKIRLIQEV